MPSIFAPIIVDSFHCFFDDSSPSWSNRWTVLLKRAQSDCREKRGWNTDIIHNANSNNAVRSVLEVYNSIIISKACVNWSPTCTKNWKFYLLKTMNFILRVRDCIILQFSWMLYLIYSIYTKNWNELQYFHILVYFLYIYYILYY